MRVQVRTSSSLESLWLDDVAEEWTVEQLRRRIQREMDISSSFGLKLAAKRKPVTYTHNLPPLPFPHLQRNFV